MSATIAGDLEKIIPLMTEDVVFLTAGHPPMRGRDSFIAIQREMLKHVRIEPESDIQEIRAEGNLGCCWNHLTVNIVPVNGGADEAHRLHAYRVAQERSRTLASLARRESSGRSCLAFHF